MVVFAATISTMHGVVRYMSAEVHPFEIAFFRNLTVFLLMIPLLLRSIKGLAGGSGSSRAPWP